MPSVAVFVDVSNLFLVLFHYLIVYLANALINFTVNYFTIILKILTIIASDGVKLNTSNFKII